MLLYRSHWHFAFERDPFGEARLLRFAKAKNPPPPGSEPPPEDLPEDDPRSAFDSGLPPPYGTIPDTERDTRKKFAEVTSEKTPTEQNVEKIEEKAMQLDSALYTLEKTIDSEAVQQYVKNNNKQKEMEEQREFIRRERKWALTLQAHAADFVQWKKGALKVNEEKQSPVDQYAAFIKKLYGQKDDKDSKAIVEKLDAYLNNKENKERIARFGNPGEDTEATFEDLNRWKTTAGSINPKQFTNIIKNYYGASPTTEQRATLSRLDAVLNNPAYKDTIDLWGDPSQRNDELRIIDEMNRIANVSEDEPSDENPNGGILYQIQQQRIIREELDKITRLDEILITTEADLKTRYESMQAAEATIREIAAIAHRDHHDTNDHGSSHILFGVKFYSALEVWEAIKSVKEAYTTAWHNHSHHKSAALAKMMGESLSWVPVLGETANIALKKEQESHNEKEKNEYKDYLKTNNFKYKQLFGEHPHDHESLMHKSHAHHEHNQVRAILEYAASKGWLYDLDLSAGDDIKMVFGEDLEEMLSDYDHNDVINFYDALRGENSSGRESEIKAAHDKVKDIENIPYFMIEIEREMKACNLWAAIGIASRAIERGLIGETIPWVMTTVARVLRENPSIRKFASVDFFDKLGALSLYHSDATMGILKVARKDLYKWSQQDWGKVDGKPDQNASDEALSKLGTTLKAMRDIEEQIKQDTGKDFTDKSGNYTKAKLDRYVAQVLANQTVEIVVAAEDKGKTGKHIFNIFDSRYDYYTHKTMGQGEVSVGKEDEDYYRETTANLRADFIVIKEIFRITSTGQFANDSRANHYAAKLLSLPDEMEEKGLFQEAKNFRKTIGRKLEQYYRAEVIPSKDRATAIMAVRVNGKGFLKEIFKKGFIDKSFLEQCIREGKGVDVSKEILKELDPENFLLKEDALKTALKKTEEETTKLKKNNEEFAAVFDDPSKLSVQEALKVLPALQEKMKKQNITEKEITEATAALAALNKTLVDTFGKHKEIRTKAEAAITTTEELIKNHATYVDPARITEANKLIADLRTLLKNQDSSLGDIQAKEEALSLLKAEFTKVVDAKTKTVTSVTNLGEITKQNIKILSEKRQRKIYELLDETRNLVESKNATMQQLAQKEEEIAHEKKVVTEYAMLKERDSQMAEANERVIKENIARANKEANEKLTNLKIFPPPEDEENPTP